MKKSQKTKMDKRSKKERARHEEQLKKKRMILAELSHRRTVARAERRKIKAMRKQMKAGGANGKS